MTLLQQIAHLLPDGFLDSIERACRPQFLELPIDETLVEVQSFGAHVYVETLDVLPLPDEPFVTHLLHETRYINVKEEVRHATVAGEGRILLVSLARTSCSQHSHAAHFSARRGGARALLIRRLQRAPRPLHAESAQCRHRRWPLIPQRAGRVYVVALMRCSTTRLFRSTKASRS